MEKYRKIDEIEEFISKYSGSKKSAAALLKFKAEKFGSSSLKKINEFIRTSNDLEMREIEKTMKYYERKWKRVIMKWES